MTAFLFSFITTTHAHNGIDHSIHTMGHTAHHGNSHVLSLVLISIASVISVLYTLKIKREEKAK
jgi:hypothetical protein